MRGSNLIHFWLSSRGVSNLFRRACSLVRRFGITPRKMERALIQWMEIGHKFGVRACFAITAIVAERYSKVIKRMRSSRIEFALHGYTHTDYTKLTMEEQVAHLTKGINIFKANAIPFVGFRTPYTRWNSATIEAIQKLKIGWDSSKTVIWDVVKDVKHRNQYKKVLALYNPRHAEDTPVLPELNNGWVELPVSLPDDEILVDRFRLPTQRIKEVWESILDQTYSRGELFTLQLHPERIPICKEVVESVIRKARGHNPTIWIASLSDIADWWQERAKFSVEVEKIGQGNYKILLTCSNRATILLKNIGVQNVQVEPWYDNYQVVVGSPSVIYVEDKNLVNVTACSDKLMGLLKSEGYVIVGDPGSKYDRIHIDGRNNLNILMNSIETSGMPIIRFWRWPYGARSCLSITGDIDALTLVDFLMRVVSK